MATWHAKSHFVHDECEFMNVENVDTTAIFPPFRSLPTAAISFEPIENP
jgi:hypothetical protein